MGNRDARLQPTPSISRRTAIARAGALVAAGSCASLLACASEQRKRTESVVVYASADDVLARDVLAACSARTGIAIDPVFDTEATKTVGLENRIRAERERPRADVFWSSEGFAPVRLAREQLLRAVPEDVWTAWPEQHRARDRMWLAFSARARVVVSRMDRGVPRIDNWAQLAAPGLAKGSSAAVAIADPRFGTTNGHLAALEDAWSRARARRLDVPSMDAWLDGIRANGVSVLTNGNAATVESVASGECAYGLTDSDDALAGIARGLPLRMDVPRTLPAGEVGGGTMIVPNTVALVRGGPADLVAAERVAAFLASAECEAIIARSESRNLPLGPRATGVDAVDVGFGESDPLRFDVAAASDRARTLALDAKARLEGQNA